MVLSASNIRNMTSKELTRHIHGKLNNNELGMADCEFLITQLSGRLEEISDQYDLLKEDIAQIVEKYPVTSATKQAT